MEVAKRRSDNFCHYAEDLLEEHYENWRTLDDVWCNIPTPPRTYKIMTNKIEYGDTICFKVGHKKLTVTRVDGQYIEAQYNQAPRTQVRRCHSNFLVVQKATKNKPSPSVIKVGCNYETVHGVATLIGNRRDGAFIVETYDGDRGPSAVVTVTSIGPRVYNYTVKLENIVEKYVFHRRVEEGSVDLHDVIKRENGKLYRVIQLNTENTCTQFLKGEKLVGVAI